MTEPLRYPTKRPAWLSEFQDWPCGRCGKDADDSAPHDCRLSDDAQQGPRLPVTSCGCAARSIEDAVNHLVVACDAAGLTMGPKPDWTPERLAQYRALTRRGGTT